MTSKQVLFIRPNLNWITVPKHDPTYDFSVDRQDKYYKAPQKPPAPQFPDVKTIGIPDYWNKTYLVWPKG